MAQQDNSLTKLDMDLDLPIEKNVVESVEEEDPFALQELADDDSTPWAEMTGFEKFKTVSINIGKVVATLGLLYLFVCSLDCLSLGFRLLGGKTTGEIFRSSDLIQNPIAGCMIGILVTVLVQSSSTATSIVVSMVGAEFLMVRHAIPIIMGTNIGTAVTAILVSLTQVADKNRFRRAFAGATVHDMFNWLTVITMLIIELTGRVLEKISDAIVSGIAEQTEDGNEIEILGKITKPTVNRIVQIEKKVLECWSNPNCTDHDGDDATLLKVNCTNDLDLPVDCNYIFEGTSLSDAAVGGIVLAGSLIILCTCLILIVKILHSVLQGQIAKVIRKVLNANIPYVPWITGYLAILVGAVMTFLVQSSSVFTSALNPLLGLGVISIERAYPLTLGSNIGTTTTALLASLAVSGKNFKPSLQIALCHLFFNLFGIMIYYPIPFMRFPIRMAKFLGNTTANYRWFAFIYVLSMYFLLPLIAMGLSFLGAAYVITFAGLVALLAFLLIVISVLQKKKPQFLPPILRSWKWLPKPLRSLEPLDNVFGKMAICSKYIQKDDDNTKSEDLVKKLKKDDLVPAEINYSELNHHHSRKKSTVSNDSVNNINLVQVNSNSFVDIDLGTENKAFEGDK